MSDIPGNEAVLSPLPDDAPISFRTVSVGGILSGSFGVFRQAFGQVVLLTALMRLPGLLLQLANQGASPAASMGNTGAQTLLNLVLGSVATGAVTYSVFMRLRGRPASTLTALGVAFKRLLPMIGVALMAGLFMTLATFLLIIPGIIVFCMLYVAVPAVVVERTGVFGALSRSAALTKGYKWSIFGAMVVLLIVAMVLGGLAGGIGVVLHLFLPGSYAFILVTWVVSMIVGGWMAVAAAVTYHDLRVEKDGVQIEDLARVFD